MGKLRAIKVMWHRLICFRTRLRVRLLSGVGRARKCEDKEHAIHCGTWSSAWHTCQQWSHDWPTDWCSEWMHMFLPCVPWCPAGSTHGPFQAEDYFIGGIRGLSLLADTFLDWPTLLPFEYCFLFVNTNRLNIRALKGCVWCSMTKNWGFRWCDHRLGSIHRGVLGSQTPWCAALALGEVATTAMIVE